MGYKGLVDSMLTRAFNLAGDLKTPATFTRKTTNQFNFNTQVVTDTSTTVATHVVEIDGKSTNQSRKTLTKTLLVKIKDVGDLGAFDTVSLPSGVWKCGAVEKNDGYTGLIIVTKES